MAIVEQVHLPHAPRTSWLATQLGALQSWLERRATARELASLTNHQLRDLGLSQTDVEAIASGRRPARRL